MTISSRRTFVKQAALLLAAVEARPWLRLEAAAGESVTAATSAGAGRGPGTGWRRGGRGGPGAGPAPILDGTSLARSGDVVVVTINHRVNVSGCPYLAEAAGSDFALSGGAGRLDIVAALQWVRAR